MSVGFVIVLVVVLAWTLTSERLSRWSLTAPVLLVVAGWIVSAVPGEAAALEAASDSIRSLAEVTLALVLFSDASQITVRWFRREAGPAGRLLGIGLPLTVLLGVAVGYLLFPGTDIWVVAVAAAALAPTDAALGASIMSDRRIPLGIRQTINVESGLNDGLATPFVLFFIAAASATEGRQSVATAMGEALVEILVAVVVGVLVGAVGGYLVSVASRAGWASPLQEPIGVLALSLLSYVVSVGLGGNGFVAAFVAGTAFGTAVARHRPPESIVFTERFGLLLSFGVWFVFGAVMVPIAFRLMTWQMVAYAAAVADARPDAPGNARAAGDRLAGRHRGPRGMARAPRAGLHRVRAAGLRGPRPRRVGRAGGRPGVPDGAALRPGPRAVRGTGRRLVRPSTP